MAVAVCYERPTRFARLTVADEIGIEKGTIIKLVSPNYGTAATADNDPAGGIAWMEKVADDGSTEVTVALDGVWGLSIGSAAGVTVGFDVVNSGINDNEVKAYTSLDDEKGYVFGKALETVGASTTATSVVAKVRLDI